MMQGGGRFRNITSGEIVVGVGAQAEWTPAITAAELGERYEVEVVNLGRARGSRIQMMRKLELAGLGKLDVTKVCPVDNIACANDMLVTATAYDRAEHFFSSTMARWVGTFKYMCIAKGYSVKVCELDAPTLDDVEDYDADGISFKTSLVRVDQGREQTISNISVTPFIGTKAIETLKQMASGGIAMDIGARDDFFSQYADIGITPDNLRIAYEKAHACNILHRNADDVPAEVIIYTNRNELQVRVYEAMQLLQDHGPEAAFVMDMALLQQLAGDRKNPPPPLDIMHARTTEITAVVMELKSLLSPYDGTRQLTRRKQCGLWCSERADGRR
eukprot:TRINITY_DN1304_c0_g2_i2.p1 TRINITY_DN1304_c0_g2~~TRINITY_DN1304_c0_g2_i2.p1  ORF type:complete len:370 (+),score=63.57 TRINITY_DN1304_c0_g2_i2:118-1110(+)